LQIIVTALHKIPNERQFELASRYLCEQLLANFAKVSVLREAGASNRYKQFRRPGPRTITRSFGNPPTPGERLFAPENVCSTCPEIAIKGSTPGTKLNT